MVQKEVRVVLDTNVLVSALLFIGPLNRLASLWMEGRIALLLSKDVFVEYLRVLAYPKFELTVEEIKSLVDEYVLPFAEMVKVKMTPRIVRADPADDKFLALASAGRAMFVISGDKHLLALKKHGRARIVTAREFLDSTAGI